MMKLFHTSFSIVEKPSITEGRKNADFAQGFYLSDDEEFSKRWARRRKGMTTYLNSYTLHEEDLRIKTFSQDEEWFDYIFANRAGKIDSLKDYDVIIGPIANDTLYDTWGMLTSGVLDKDTSLKCLKIGNVYRQIVIKSEKALHNLHFTKAVELDASKVQKYRDAVAREEEVFQEEFARIVEDYEEGTYDC